MTSFGEEFLGPTPQIAVADADAAIAFTRRHSVPTNWCATPPENAFWGDRYTIIEDPMGHAWSLATPVDDLSPGGQNLRARAWVLGQPPEGE